MEENHKEIEIEEGPIKIKIKRCPKGTRKNKAGDCIPVKGEIERQVERQVEVPIEGEKEELLEGQVIISNKQRKNIKKPAIVIHPEPKPEPEKPSVDCNNPAKIFSNDCNKFLLKKELLEREELAANPDTNESLYPTLNDPNFIIKIAEKKEFNDTQYNGEVLDVQKQAEVLSKADFELAPHQAFVRNFLSFQTPYNSLLLYHNLGTGKTLSAIGVCEEQRSYMKQMGLTKRIIVVASPNVQDNFRTQLFDERKLKLVDGLWNIRDATGNKLLKEINPMNMKGMEKEKVISQIKGLINQYYLFIGYFEFANYIENVKLGLKSSGSPKPKTTLEESRAKRIENIQKRKEERVIINETKKTSNQMTRIMVEQLKREFENRLIVIDEVHNIRITEDNENKNVAIQLMDLVKSVTNLRLLLLSATPMYNSYKEIVWLINLMNINDRRGAVKVSDVFDADGDFKVSETGEEIGRELLIRKATGYVSFVRGENPYTFPFRIYPTTFDPDRSVLSRSFVYPKYQMNGKEIPDVDKLKILDIYLTPIGSVQALAYKYIIQSLQNQDFNFVTKKGVTREMPNFENMEAFGYALLQIPIEALIISYPIDNLEQAVSNKASESLPVASITKKNKSKAKPKPNPDITPLINVILEPTLAPIGELSEEILELTKQASSEKSVSSYEYDKNMSVKKGGGGESNGGESNGGESTGGAKIIHISKNDLVGSKGLERMMEYNDTRIPPEKGSFQYRAKTLEKYGKIFSPSEIGKYSGKIKNICESIYSPETGKVSDGIILIYSQYIDGGLLPVALALEEMGFLRYGENVKSLFKTPPAEAVDSRTMKTRKNNTNMPNFKPAKYIMITGDPRISPNNNYEVKAVTSEDNKDGDNIKVILISKAGSEGLDFKFIRQVHILEPWYNMNRLEQIIGRAVRNFSHKDLPFEKRNVEIFMYGTTLTSDNTDALQSGNALEAADLYVYRSAEFKASQIGKVSRLLKETAVDCILNNAQTNFTQENMEEINQRGVKQVLSTGQEIPDFKVGDVPFSPTCDYMADCEFKCIPNKEITEKDIKMDTYNDAFIMLNSEKIIKRIRALMKEKFFYKKDDLIQRINYPKPYPLVQIYAALTQIIEDTTEFIIDKYGRTGYLVNIGDYYLFQPSELNSPSLSVFDRSVPIDFKHDTVEIYGSVNPAPSPEKEGPSIQLNPSAIPPWMKEIQENYDLVTTFYNSDENVPSGDDNWYKHCGVTMRKMKKDGIPEADLFNFLIEHIVDLMMFDEKIRLLYYLYSLDIVNADSLEYKMKEYIDTQLIQTRRFIGIILISLNERKMFILKDKKWIPAQSEDEIDLNKAAFEKLSLKNGRTFNSLIGMIDLEQKNKYLVFKLKHTELKRNKGSRCDEAVKSKKILLLNEIVGGEKYVDHVLTPEEVATGMISTKGMVKSELCSLMEFLLRYYNKTNKDNKYWFVTHELYNIYSKMYQI